MKRRSVVVGGGIFGVTAAAELHARGDDVTLLEIGALPQPLAESTDVSKVVRMDYGADETYTEMMERALVGWRELDARFAPDRPLFHEAGVAFLTRAPMTTGGFEHESFEMLRARGHALERLDERAISTRFPAWNGSRFVDGYFNPQGGWVESGAVVARLAQDLRQAGVVVRASTSLDSLIERGGRVEGVLTRRGERLESDVVVLACGAWIPSIAPWIADAFRTVGQPVFQLAPDDRDLFETPRFCVFGADIARTGWYGFPLNAEGLVKIANHGRGRAMHPESPERKVTDEEIAALRLFVATTFPSLERARLDRTRICVYCDTWDEHFWIAPDPERAGLVVATGGSGHAFKFAPLVGRWIADAVEGKVVARFRWRPEVRPDRGEEAARHR
jgi:glycine/D-amino acid oxidase-like deaminating enzyme